MGEQDIHVEFQWLSPVGKRHPREVQRRIAQEIRKTIGGAILSHSHSRGLIAVASASAPVVKLGIDVEFTDPKRPWREIVALLAREIASVNPSDDNLCRLWTFGEAYFKALGDFPSPEILMEVATNPAAEQALVLAPRRYWRSERLPDGFWSTIVWETAA